MRNARLFYLIIIYSTFFQSFVKNASIKLIDPNKLKNTPMKKSDFSFDSLDIKFEYINMRNTKYTKLVKRYLSHVSIIFGRLVYTKNFNKKIQYNKDTLRRFKIKLKGKDEKSIPFSEIKHVHYLTLFI